MSCWLVVMHMYSCYLILLCNNIRCHCHSPTFIDLLCATRSIDIAYLLTYLLIGGGVVVKFWYLDAVA